MTEPTTPIERSFNAASEHAGKIDARAIKVREAVEQHIAQVTAEHVASDPNATGTHGAEDQ